MAEKSKILVIGGTGYIGKFIVQASTKAGHQTFVLVRQRRLTHVKAILIERFMNSGVTILYGDIHDHDSLVKAISCVDVVISTTGLTQIPDQMKIIEAIKEAGNIKRFFPSEFGVDVDHFNGVEPLKTLHESKISIRRAVEAAGIPYTFVSSVCSGEFFLPGFIQPGAISPPREKVVILGDGNAKVVYNMEADISTYTIKSVDDPRAMNKVLYIKPKSNIYSFNELVSLWEKKIGRSLEKSYVTEEELLKTIREAPFPLNATLAVRHCLFVKGVETCSEIEPSLGVEASNLYPEVKYTTVDEYLDQLV